MDFKGWIRIGRLARLELFGEKNECFEKPASDMGVKKQSPNIFKVVGVFESRKLRGWNVKNTTMTVGNPY